MDAHVGPTDATERAEALPDLTDLPDHRPDLTDRPDLTALPDLTDLPDLTELSLAELGTIQNPLLQEVLADLRERARRPSEMLWGWNSSF
ncbi:FxSxx-COOH cyclophane-containing RiPP peptide [Streptomyces sp. NPDC020951]|uniref:FxSxx-COOH cyclophane-containing RiPP peptide n=1 Tax=Streptomyces sp. NPDC020951 TaxID=3365104 RepID=UPI0037A0D78B